MPIVGRILMNSYVLEKNIYQIKKFIQISIRAKQFVPLALEEIGKLKSLGYL